MAGRQLLLLVLLTAAEGAQPCLSPANIQQAVFEAEGASWTACEDVRTGGIALHSSTGETVWLPQTRERISAPDDAYYLGLNKSTVIGSSRDLLGEKLLADGAEPSWAAVEKALPPIRRNSYGPWGKATDGCVRSFVGSRSAAYDVSFSDGGMPCGQAPPPINMVIRDANASQHIDSNGILEGLVGGYLPVISFLYPIVNSSCHWTMVAAPKPEMHGSREQDVWYRFQQVCCDSAADVSCKLIGNASYFDTYWWVGPGPAPVSAPPAPFYANLLQVVRYWETTFRNETRMELQLPATNTTNGSWLSLQAKHGSVKGMITRVDTWFPRYGVSPGYGAQADPGNGFADTLTAEVQAALEWGMFPYAGGLLDNFLSYYVRHGGAVSYRGPETAQSGLLLTLLAKHYAYTRDDSLLVTHFDKIQAVVNWLNASRAQSLSYPASDPRYGIPIGDSEADNFVRVEGYTPAFSPPTAPLHYYASAAAIARGWLELGRVYAQIAKPTPGMLSLGGWMVDAAAVLRRDLHASMNRTVIQNDSAAAGTRCWPFAADPQARGCVDVHPTNSQITPWRSYAELMYAGMLEKAIVRDIWDNLGHGGLLRLGSISTNSMWFAFVLHGFGQALLQADMVPEYLLHWFSHSAHSYTRGTWTTPEGSPLDREAIATPYSAPAEQTAPLYLRWAITFEDPDLEALQLLKAVPREWLSGGESINATNIPTRYGRLSLQLHSELDSFCRINVNLALPDSWAEPALQPAGGLTLHLRTPAAYAGNLKNASVGSNQLTSSMIDSLNEALIFPSAWWTTRSRLQAMRNIVISYARCNNQGTP